MSVRLDEKTEALILRMARTAGRSKSWVVREAVAAYAVTERPLRRPFEALSPFIGAGDTGRTDLSADTGDRLTELLGKKARARRSR